MGFLVAAGGPGRVALQGGHRKKYCADEGNRVICNRPWIRGWEKFTALRVGVNVVALKGGRHGKFCADDAHGVRCNRPWIRGWEKFNSIVIPRRKPTPPFVVRHGMTVALKGGRGRKYCADESFRVIYNRPWIAGWEKFQVRTGGPGKVALIGGRLRNKYCADEGNRIACNRPWIRGWEKFTAIRRGVTGVALRGGRFNRFCADDAHGVRCNRPWIKSWEIFAAAQVRL